MATIQQLLRETIDKGASDLHLSTGVRPMIRIHGDLVPTEHEVLTPDAVTALVHAIMNG